MVKVIFFSLTLCVCEIKVKACTGLQLQNYLLFRFWSAFGKPNLLSQCYLDLNIKHCKSCLHSYYLLTETSK